MRVTNSMLVANTVWNLNNNTKRLDKAQEQMSTQSKIQLPSDDPVVATRAIKYRNYVSSVEQYQKNVDDVTSWQEVTDSALSDLSDVVKRARDLTVEAANDTLSDTDRESIQSEVKQLKDETVQIMNTSYAGRYIFGGFDTDQAPYQTVSTAVGDKVTFKGQYMNLGGPVSSSATDADIVSFCTTNAGQMYQSSGSQAIQYNINFGSQIAVNVEGQDVIGQGNGNNLFDTFDKLLLGLDGSTSYKIATVTTSPTTVTTQSTSLSLSDLTSDLDQDLNRILTVRSDLGARMNYVSMTKDRLSNDYITYTKLKSNNEDVDTAQASIDVSTAEYVYEASLSVGAKVISKSLVDYLK